MKAKQKPAHKPAKERKPRKKPQFEDGVRAALVAGAVICAAVLGAGGFFAVRSILSGGGDNPPPASAAGQVSPESGEAGPVDGADSGESGTFPGENALPELSDAIRELDGAFNGTAAPEETPPQGNSGAAANTAAGTAAGAAGTAGAAAGTAGLRAVPGKQPILPADRKGILVLVIDDAGNNLPELDPFLKFPGPLTIAVLPGLPNSVEAARRVRAAGKELFLHQPMEALNGQNPGPGLIKTGMAPEEVKSILIKNLGEIGPVAGFNNHEGSRATMDPAIMRPVLELCRDSGLRFLDSRTIADTAAPGLARELGIAIAQRDVFLDNEQDRESIIAAVETACKKAAQNGVAVMIGHAWSPKLAGILTELYPRLVEQGYFFTTISGILDPGK